MDVQPSSSEHTQQCNGLIARAVMAYRFGKARPPAMSDGASGTRYIESSQSFIKEKLSEADHRVYCHVRDKSRMAVRLIRQSKREAARRCFQEARDFLTAQSPSEELCLLGASRVDQAEAYLDALDKKYDDARSRITTCLDNDLILETTYGYALFHIQRVHLLHLLMRVEAGSGQVLDAVTLADTVIRYILGQPVHPPVSTGWHTDKIAEMPDIFRQGMMARMASEVGIILANSDTEQARPLLDAFSCWTHFQDYSDLTEIFEWGRLKTAFLNGDHTSFLEQATPFLTAGRRETMFWYTAAIDLCHVTKHLKPGATRGFRDEVATDGEALKQLPPEMMPGLLQRKLAEQGRSRLPEISVPERRFRAYNLGLPRTGTSSITTIFGNYRAYTEYMEQESVEQVIAWHAGYLTDEDLRDYVLKRDQAGILEMDSASFNHFYMDTLIESFPDAKFVFTIRECHAWVNSFLKLLVRWHRKYLDMGLETPDWMEAYGPVLFGEFTWDGFSSYEMLIPRLEELVPRFIQCWSTYNRSILDRLPMDRSFILRTEDISFRLEDLAAFVGVPRSSLTDRDHMGAAPDDENLLVHYDRAQFDALLSRYGGDVVNRVFTEANGNVFEGTDNLNLNPVVSVASM